jgi:hypothetical protein
MAIQSPNRTVARGVASETTWTGWKADSRVARTETCRRGPLVADVARPESFRFH